MMDREKRVGAGRIKEDKTSYLSQVPDGRLRDAKFPDGTEISNSKIEKLDKGKRVEVFLKKIFQT